VVECLLYKQEALSSNSNSTEKIKKKKRQKIKSTGGHVEEKEL
jgi:hypothetical protein